ncbi:hypothetical protein BGZ95_011018 [Linnemannia exigua]|uniref:F-box domain-containing protein n=1 Tax=Linnemannia exigua TaxID=604196 RepID=A0AAD4DB17_9FUNG|nr:hypothetical protein BGZ95_011018 [Linnemannia exigua]
MTLFARFFEKLSLSDHEAYRKQRQQQQQQQQDFDQRTTPSHPLFTINELLEHIFSFLDDATLTRIIILVSRQWLQVARPRVRRDVYWDHRWRTNNLKETLGLLPGAGRFHCCCPDTAVDDENRQMVLTALRTHDQLYEQGLKLRRGNLKQNQKKGLRMFFTPLRELEIQVSYALQQRQDNSVNTLPLPSTLTVLQMQLSNYHGQPIDLGRILVACPQLEVLQLRVFDYTSVDGSKIAQDRQLLLQSFVLTGVQFNQTSLEALLAVTPNLTELKLINIYEDHPAYDIPRLVTRLATSTLVFKSFHFSIRENVMSVDQIRDKMITVCPVATEWSLRCHDIIPQILQELEQLPNVITSLELPRHYSYHLESCVTNASVRDNPAILHGFLCTSPHLVHLKNVKLNALQFEGMDLHHRSSFGGLDHWIKYRYVNSTNNADAIVPGVWACRGLKTLYLNLHGHGEFGLLHPVHSRIVFGYIAAVCPNLEDLQLTVSKECRRRGASNQQVYFTDFCMRLEGGFCLLSRLKFLTTFRVDAYSISRNSGCWPVDMTWITAEGNRPEQRERRREAVKLWDDKLDVERRVEKERLTTGARYACILSIENGDYNRSQDGDENEEEGGLAGKLKNLGLLSEVKKAIEEMDQDGYHCFPVLDRVSLSWALPQRPTDAIAYLFPNGRPR